MPTPPLEPDPRKSIIGSLLPPSREEVEHWHKLDRCWRCGSPMHYAEACSLK